MLKVTVIVPVYNASQYLHECIQSVLNQSFSSFELLLINDGSTDNSRDICDHYAGRDTRVKVFNKENGGVSSARNVGIAKARGEWITFIDSDDYIQNDYFKILDLQLNTDWIHLDMKRAVISDIGVGINFKNKVYKMGEFVDVYSLYPHFPEACAKFFNTSIIKRNNLRFNEDLRFGEDSVFNLKYLKYCEVISTSNISKYVYRNDEDGLSKLKQDLKNDSILFKEIEEELERHQYPLRFCEQTIRIPLFRRINILYQDKSISPRARRLLLKKYVEKYYRVVIKIYTNPKIQLFFQFAYMTRIYFVLDCVLSRINKRLTRFTQLNT